MDDPRDSPVAGGAASLLSGFGREGAPGRSLRAQLAARFPDRPAEEIEDAVQSACGAFLEDGTGIVDLDAAFVWIRTAAHRALTHELRLRRRSVVLDPADEAITGAPDRDADPVGRMIAEEEESEMAGLVAEVAEALTPRRREVLALWAAGRNRPRIAAETGLSERAVKRALEKIMGRARSTLADRAGGGCEEGEPLVTRLACGLATAAEAGRARAHLERCGRCAGFAEQMDEWRQKAGALLPLPAVEAASPGLLGRALGQAGEAVSSARRAVLGGGAQAKERVATLGYPRAGSDPTPLAGIRPGAVAAVVVGCLAVGTGATYCAGQGVDPLGAVAGLVPGGQEEPRQGQGPGTPTAEAPAVEPVETPPVEEGPVYETETAPQEEAPEAGTAKSESQKPEEPSAVAEAETTTEEVTPPPEQAFEPASPDYPATEGASSSSSETESTNTSSTAAEPKAVPANEAPQFGGP